MGLYLGSNEKARVNLVKYVRENGGDSGSSSAIIDVDTLPTENINESKFYRLVSTSADVYIAGLDFDGDESLDILTMEESARLSGINATIIVEVVETLPETFSPSDYATFNFHAYVVKSTGIAYISNDGITAESLGMFMSQGVVPDKGWSTNIDAETEAGIYCVEKTTYTLYTYNGGKWSEVGSPSDGDVGNGFVIATATETTGTLSFVSGTATDVINNPARMIIMYNNSPLIYDTLMLDNAGSIKSIYYKGSNSMGDGALKIECICVVALDGTYNITTTISQGISNIALKEMYRVTTDGTYTIDGTTLKMTCTDMPNSASFPTANARQYYLRTPDGTLYKAVNDGGPDCHKSFKLNSTEIVTFTFVSGGTVDITFGTDSRANAINIARNTLTGPLSVCYLVGL